LEVTLATRAVMVARESKGEWERNADPFGMTNKKDRYRRRSGSRGRSPFGNDRKKVRAEERQEAAATAHV
jgi:hypothetical protein